MADKMQFDLVSPERKLVSGEATEVQIPGADGDMTAMPDHAPTITTLRPGVLSVALDKGTEEYFVTGGFAEIGAEGTSVLAEVALPKAEVTSELLGEHLKAARDAVEAAADDGKDAAAKRVSDFEAAAAQMGVSV
ncbi:MAG: F0F1 ATP synthase subunit epsilon [Pseudomonadota bacterium]